jgi:ferredoxin
MKIRAPSCDVCGECYIYKSAFRYKDAFLPEGLLDVDEGADEEALDEVTQEEEQALFFTGKATTVMRGGHAPDVDDDDNSLSSTFRFLFQDLTQEELNIIQTVADQSEVAQDQERNTNEAIMTCASGYVVMARVMREMAKEETMYALEDEENNVVH